MSTVNQENEIVNEPKSAPTDQVVKPVVDGEKADVDTEKTKPEARATQTPHLRALVHASASWAWPKLCAAGPQHTA